MMRGSKKKHGTGEPEIDRMEMVKTLNETDTHRKGFSDPSGEGR